MYKFLITFCIFTTSISNLCLSIPIIDGVNRDLVNFHSNGSIHDNIFVFFQNEIPTNDSINLNNFLKLLLSTKAIGVDMKHLTKEKIIHDSLPDDFENEIEQTITEHDVMLEPKTVDTYSKSKRFFFR